MPTATVIICTKDRREDLRRCLESLRAQTRAPDQLVVVDAGENAVEDVVREFQTAAKTVAVDYLKSAPGLTRQRNLGIRRATGDIVHFLDDDVILDAPYLDEMQKSFEAAGAADLAGVSPIVRLPSGPPPRLGSWLRRVFLLMRIDGDGRMLPSGFGTFTWYSGYREPHAIEVACGCCAYRRAIFDDLQFDEFFAGYGHMEDQEFSYRASQRGRLEANPRATLLHVAASSGRADARRLARMQIENHYYVFRKLLEPNFARWLCFAWSEAGESILRVLRAVRTGDAGYVIGSFEGYLSILRSGASPRQDQ